MKTVILIILVAIFVTVSTNPVCQYSSIPITYSGLKIYYSCKISFLNLNGNNNFKTIDGYHVGGYGDNSVDIIMTSFGNPAGNFSSTVIPTIICSKFPNLIGIQLYSQVIVSFIDSSTLSSCSNLEYFEISNSVIPYFPADVFDNNPKMRIIRLARNAFKEISPDAFKKVPNLETLILTGNELTYVEPAWFENLSKLTYLELSANRLRDIPENAFINLGMLKKINFNGNWLTKLNPKWFSPLVSIEEVFFASNLIGEILPNCFVTNIKMKTLHLYSNVISCLNGDSFATEVLERLEYFYTFGNPIKGMDRKIFDSLLNLNTFTISGNCGTGSFTSANITLIDELLNNCFLNYLIDCKPTTTDPTTTSEETSEGPTSTSESTSSESATTENQTTSEETSESPKTTTDNQDDPPINVETKTNTYAFMPFDGSFRAEILVKASKNAYIAFSNIINDPIPPIEIIIGAGSNTRTEIFENMKKVIEVSIPEILSDAEFRKFVVEFKDGVVTVYQGDEIIRLLSHTLSAITDFEVDYIAFKSM